MSDFAWELRQRCVYLGCVEAEDVQHLNPQDDTDAARSVELRQEAEQLARDLGGDIRRKVKRSYIDGASLGGATTGFLETVLVTFGASGAAVTFLSCGKEVLLKWMDNSSQRSIRLKSGDFEVEIKGKAGFDEAAGFLSELMGASEPGSVLAGERGRGASEGVEQPRLSCRGCVRETPMGGRRLCPECGHSFRGNGWDGIHAHWRAHHEAVMSYEDFWSSLCDGHRGHSRK